MAQSISITVLKENEEGIIHSVSGGKAFNIRLAGMGIVPGIRVKVLRNRGGRMIVMASDTRVALGRGEAENIAVTPAGPAEVFAKRQHARKPLLVALTGQPNVGKSTVFNVMTGLSQHVGNWPGKTVERKQGTHTTEDYEITIVDLPGTYSLTSSSEEERVARDFIISEQPDVIVALVNAAALERNLYLVSELLLLDTPLLVAVNMTDVAEEQGIHLDTGALERSLGVPVVSMVATRNIGLRQLITKIIELVEGTVPYSPVIPEVSPNHRAEFDELLKIIGPHIRSPYTPRWAVTKLMEGDPEVTKMLETILPRDVWDRSLRILLEHEDSLHAIVDGRYEWIEGLARSAVQRFRKGQILITDRIDHVLTRPLYGIPILFGILGLTFLLTYEVGFPLQKMLEGLVASLADHLRPALSFAPVWVKGLIIEGAIGGTGYIVTFLPILLVFFFLMAFLEDVGYMSRAAFVMDRFMHLVGLHGKSFIPLCLGFGCNVPAILNTAIIESRKARLLTIFLTPFVPCPARLAVLTFVSAAMFGAWASIASTALIALNILVLGISGRIVHNFFLKEEPLPFIMELPLYHRPNIKVIATVVWYRSYAFLKLAGTVILGVSVAMWVLSNVPWGVGVENSLLGRIGRFIEPLGSPLGLDWRMIIALVSSLVAKENSIAVLGVLYGVGNEGLSAVLPQMITGASALSFLVVLMLFIPCAATMAAMRKEMGSWKWFLGSFVSMLAVSYLLGILAYQAARLLGI
jgi:ferrous iron transport protein B